FMEDGRLIIGYDNTSGANVNDVSATYLDVRPPGETIIGDRGGAPRDVLVGTVGDDVVDGRALDDQLFGGIGDDLVTGGADDDILSGGLGNDTLFGGPGQDQLLGDEGDDVLWGGISNVADPKVSRDLATGLLAAGVDATLVGTNPPADVISGGDGKDTISFEGEFGAFDINLASGLVLSSRTGGPQVLEDAIGAIVDDGAGETVFVFTHDVENAKGGVGNDRLTGDAGDNVL